VYAATGGWIIIGTGRSFREGRKRKGEIRSERGNAVSNTLNGMKGRVSSVSD